MEVSVDYVRCNLTQLTFIGVVALLLAFPFQAHLPHKFLDRLVVDINTLVVELIRDSAISIPSSMFMIYLADPLPNAVVAIRLPDSFSVVIEC